MEKKTKSKRIEITEAASPTRMWCNAYEKQFRKLQVELRWLQEWIGRKELRMVVVFEGPGVARFRRELKFSSGSY
jgi:polyphosphate kinase 2 (PPK2 family)